MSKGFTIIELMVSVSIIALMAAAVFFNWRPVEDTFSLVRSAHQLSDDIRRVQQMSISTRSFACGSPDPEYSGYGIYLETDSPTEYYLFENCSTDNRLYRVGDQLIETQGLEDGVEILSIVVGAGVNSASILFIPPDPKIYINESVSGVEAIITLALSRDISQTKQVRINNGGRIEIQ
jgi:prepilin-type N-terminal cleavage/methylation domain-containing protein